MTESEGGGIALSKKADFNARISLHKDPRGRLSFYINGTDVNLKTFKALAKASGGVFSKIGELASFTISPPKGDLNRSYKVDRPINLYSGKRLLDNLLFAGFSEEVARKVVKIRAKGPFTSSADFQKRTGLTRYSVRFDSGKKKSGEFWNKLGVRSRPPVRLVKQAGVASGKALGHTVQSLLTIVVMHMCTEYYFTGTTSPESALRALDSPELIISLPFAGFAGMGAEALSRPGEILLSKVGAGKLTTLLKPLTKTIATLGTFEFVGAFASEAMKGLHGKDGHLSFIEIMKSSALRKKYFRNLVSLVADGKKSNEIIERVFQERILSGEFAMMVTGMMVGTKLGAAAGRFGFVAGPKVGVFSQILGGFTGGVLGAVGGTVVGRNIDVAWKCSQLPGKRERLEEFLTKKNTGDFDTDYENAKESLNYINEYFGYREKTVELLAALYTLKLAKLLEGNEHDNRLRQEADALKSKVLSLYDADMKLLGRLIEKEGASEPSIALLTTLENETYICKAIVQAQLINFESFKDNSFSTSRDEVVSTSELPQAEDLMFGLEVQGP